MNKNKEIIVLDHKRSNAINIGMTKLPPPRSIKTAILKMDATIMNREGIEVRSHDLFFFLFFVSSHSFYLMNVCGIYSSFSISFFWLLRSNNMINNEEHTRYRSLLVWHWAKLIISRFLFITRFFKLHELIFHNFE